MTIEALIARGFQLLLALTGAYTLALWFALVVWTFRDIESRSRSVIAQIFSTLVVVLFFIPGVLIYLLLRPKETLDEAFGRALEEEYLLQDLEDLSLCANCHRPVREDYVACPHCFTELRHTCPSCNRLVDVSWAICAYCTAELVTTTGEIEAPVTREERPSLLPLPLRVLRERTEAQLGQMLSPGEGGQLPEGQTPAGGNLVARETQAAGAWTDGTGKGSWFLSRAREVFAPLTGAESHANGHTPPNGTATQGGAHAEGDTSWSVQAPGQIPAPPPPPLRWPNGSNGSDDADEEPAIALRSAAPDGQPAAPSRELFSYRRPKRPAPPPVGEE